MVCPMKNTIYPEYLPKTSVSRVSPTVLDTFNEFLRSQTEIAYLDVTKIMQDLKIKQQVFHKTDFHWNDVTAFIVAKELVGLMSRLHGHNNIWEHDLSVKIEYSALGGENNSLGVLYPYTEPMYNLSTNHTFDSGVVNDIAPGEWNYDSDSRSPKVLLPKTILFGNSFSDGFLRAGFTRYFSSLHRIHSNDISSRFRTIDEHAKFVVIQEIESNLFRWMNSDFWNTLLNELH